MEAMHREHGVPSILIIDDERTFADTLAKRLSMRGLTCSVEYDGRSGLAAAVRGAFAGVVLDLRLPDLDGVEVLRRMMDLHPGLPVVILTGHGTDKDKRQCMEIGASGFLHKPVDLERLVRLLVRGRPGER
jgi:DNA-binding response OmpR family regulator